MRRGRDTTDPVGATLSALERACEALDVVVRDEPLADGVRGGLCRVNGRSVVLVDPRTPPGERVRILARALLCFDIDSVFLLPAARAAIEGARPR